MELENWGQIIQSQMANISGWEMIGVFFGVAEVIYAKYNKVWLYPCGITSILITIYLYFNVKLFAEIILQFYYLIMSIYGWYIWVRKRKSHLQVSYSSDKELKVAICIVIFSICVLYIFLNFFTSSDVPLWDSMVSAFAWAGMWLLTQRKIENWIFLNISNFIAIPLMLHKGLILYSILTLFLFIIALLGYNDWKKIIKKEKY
ncbi:nicotinamide riboside transporter PnuC [Apibacter adventoris]|uniref:nicotinamide riboside transporter PnuC n=1 Tax=Apibacter adventoris TaxID=1679466 RepID=UPI000CF5FB37|nr:nicotinamide riboside transporter PnuC [Apibacter adventoris]PQL94939.1 nicotinamide riboside transporter PnuC [Apibacter adventoris]